MDRKRQRERLTLAFLFRVIWGRPFVNLSSERQPPGVILIRLPVYVSAVHAYNLMVGCFEQLSMNKRQVLEKALAGSKTSRSAI